MASNAKPRKAKRKQSGFTPEDWAAVYGEVGDIRRGGWCANCRSFWCPHAAPGLYRPRDLSRFYNGRGPLRRA